MIVFHQTRSSVLGLNLWYCLVFNLQDLGHRSFASISLIRLIPFHVRQIQYSVRHLRDVVRHVKKLVCQLEISKIVRQVAFIQLELFKTFVYVSEDITDD